MRSKAAGVALVWTMAALAFSASIAYFAVRDYRHAIYWLAVGTLDVTLVI